MFVLASQSPRRKELLSIITDDFVISPAKGEERADFSLSSGEYVSALAEAKAKEISALYPDKAVIGADTVVVFGNEILGKPKDASDAERMLSMLSGKTHSVFTGVCVYSKGKAHTFCDETKVTFRRLTDEEIREYISSGEPFDKAGAYGIQDKGALLTKKIDGDFYNVMGLPVGRLYCLLKELELLG